MREAGALSRPLLQPASIPCWSASSYMSFLGLLPNSMQYISIDDMHKLIHVLNSAAVGETLSTAIVDRSFNV